jgi:hypothetical protein
LGPLVPKRFADQRVGEARDAFGVRDVVAEGKIGFERAPGGLEQVDDLLEALTRVR